MTFRNAWVSLAIPTLALALVSCETAGNKDANGNSAATTGSADSMSLAGFLKTDYKPLMKWLDEEQFDIDYKHMTPEVSNLPTAAPPFNFSGKDLTRREVLKKIASHWKLKMSFVVDASGKPTAVKVEG